MDFVRSSISFDFSERTRCDDGGIVGGVRCTTGLVWSEKLAMEDELTNANDLRGGIGRFIVADELDEADALVTLWV